MPDRDPRGDEQEHQRDGESRGRIVEAGVGRHRTDDHRAEEDAADRRQDRRGDERGQQREAGLLERRQYDEIPPRVEYSLTDDGEQLCELLEPLLEWVESRSA